MTSEPAPTALQLPETPQKIFVHPDGTPITIFVDASEIPNSSRLLRTNCAANIVHFPSAAQVILVDPTVNSGRQFIRDWSKDAGKIVLEYLWVTRCMNAGRALLAEDDWGGSIAVDDGKPISTSEDMNDPALQRQSPLPTPRPTPDSPLPGKSISRRLSAHRSSIHLPDPSTNSNAFPTFRQELSGFPNGHDQSASANSQSSMLSLTHSPRRDQTFDQIALEHSSFLNPSDFTMFTNSTLHPSQPSGQLSQTTAGTPSIDSSTALQNALANGNFGVGMNMGNVGLSPAMGPMNMNGLPVGHLQNTTLLAAILDVVRNQANMSVPSWGQQGIPGGLALNNFLLPQSNIDHQALSQHQLYYGQSGDSNGSSPSPSNAMPGQLPALPPSSGIDKSRALPATPLPSHETALRLKIPSSIRRRRSRSSSPSIRHGHRHKIKERQGRHTPQERSRAIMSHQAERSKLRRKRSLSSSDSEESVSISLIGSPPPKSQTQPPPTGSPRKAGEIFLSQSGEPLAFFVQVDLRNRYQVIQGIKKNGGRLTGDHLQADYAILYSRSAAFKDLLAGIQSVGRPALTPMFVEDCINAEALLDPDEGRGHIIDAKLGDNSKSGSHAATGTGRTPRDNKPTTRFPKKRAEKRIGKDAGSAPGIRPTDASDTSSAALLGHLQRRDPSTPSPPPVDERNRKSDGRWSFTAEEKAFVLKYGHVLIQRDVSVANIAIARKIQEKAPHHGFNSWYGFIQNNCRSDFEVMRKRVGIANRKAEMTSMGRQSGSNWEPDSHLVPEEQVPESTTAQPSPWNVQDVDRSQLLETTQSQAEDQKEDISAICRFFADGGGNDSDDELVWSNLTKYKHCKSHSDWSEFYRAHEQEIHDGIKDLLKAAGELPGHEDQTDRATVSFT